MYQKLIDRSEAWLKYSIELYLNEKSEKSLHSLRDEALSDGRIQGFLNDVSNFHGTLVTNHRSPELPIKKLLFLLDIGFDTTVPEIQEAVNQIMMHKDENGVYQSLTNVPVRYGGAGIDVFSWCLCDAPLLLLALIKAGADYDDDIKPGVDYLVSLCRENGFPCAVSPEQGSFRGPGKKADCCPFATLIMADLLANIPEYKASPVARVAVETLLSLWEKSLGLHPYMFYMGTDFRKIKAPAFWYDIITVAGVLSKYPYIYDDARFQGMIASIRGKNNGDGFFTPESVYLKFKDWDFGQKKQASPYLTFLCFLIFNRIT